MLATSASSDRTPPSNFDVDDGRDVILHSLRDVESDLELVVWTIPSLLPTENSSHSNPSFGVAGDYEIDGQAPLANRNVKPAGTSLRMLHA